MNPILFTILCWGLLLGHSLFANSVVRFSSNVGEIDMELFDTETPLTVANFLAYVNAGRYNQTFIHRSLPGFVIQGGGFGLNGTMVLPVTTNAAVPNEPGISNLRGTVAMAKLGNDPNSATSQWFINLADNAANLDSQNGGFTVFGRVVGNGMAVADRIASFPAYNVTAQLGGAFSDLPLQSAALTINNLILFPVVRALPGETIVREFDFSSSDQGFTSGFADLPAGYDPALYNLVADHRNLPAELGAGKGLFISGMNRSDDLWMFWKKKLTGLQPNTDYQVVLDVEMASNVAAGLVGVGGAPGESVYVKAGASQAEPSVMPDSQGWRRLTVDKGNQSTSGSAAAVLGNVAKENDATDRYVRIHRNNRSIQQSATTSADGSLWIFFGTDSGFEGKTSLYYTRAAAVLMPKAKPSLTWSTPPAIAYGTALGASQLNATANVAGNFTYTPAVGTVLSVGNHTLNVVFTPTDSWNYTTASANVTLRVTRATPSLAWSTPAAIAYGTALGASQLNATATIAGNFTYTPAVGTVLPAGNHTVNVLFTPTDSGNYTIASANVTVRVTRATPSLAWSTPAAIAYGTAIGSSQLNAMPNIVGNLTYTPLAGTVLPAGNHTLSVVFTPTDSGNYTTSSMDVAIEVGKASSFVLTIPTAAGLNFGQTLADVSLSGGAANVSGSFAFASHSTQPSAGNSTHTVLFTPTDSGNYTTASANVTLRVTRATPSLTWNAPAAIAYGTGLGVSQLNATANISGTFTYTPALGTVLPVGNHTLSVVFTPTDSGNYTTANLDVSLQVNTATAVSAPSIGGGPAPAPGGGNAPEKAKKGKGAKKSSASKSESAKSKSAFGSSAKKSGSKKPKKK